MAEQTVRALGGVEEREDVADRHAFQQQPSAMVLFVCG